MELPVFNKREDLAGTSVAESLKEKTEDKERAGNR